MNTEKQSIAIANHFRGYLFHVENKELQFVTFRLHDSVPKQIIQNWKAELRITEKTNTNSRESIILRKRIEDYEDKGSGMCFLKDPRIASLIKEALTCFDGQRYQLLEWCIMPNHVHILIKIFCGYSLSEIMHSWKSFTAHEANKILKRHGIFWMQEYFDRYIRDTQHLEEVINYIRNNPVKAGLTEWKWQYSFNSQ
jgi:REP element-mobilizing transposase RayT